MQVKLKVSLLKKCVSLFLVLAMVVFSFSSKVRADEIPENDICEAVIEAGNDSELSGNKIASATDSELNSTGDMLLPSGNDDGIIDEESTYSSQSGFNPDGCDSVSIADQSSASGILGSDEDDSSLPADEYTVSFYNGSDEYAVQTVKNGGMASYVDVGREDFPEGYVSFRGWFRNAEPEALESAFDFSTPITEDVNLYAVFSNKYLVRFIDPTGQVIHTQEVDPSNERDLVYEPSEEIVEKAAAQQEGTYFKYWCVEGEEHEANFPLSITEDTDIYAIFSNQYTVFFISDGTQVDNQSVSAGETAAEPQEPARAGYTFSHWAVYGDESKAEYDFSQPIQEDTYLIAVWNGINGIEYTVVYWMEKVGYEGDYTPQIGNQSQYDAVKTVVKTNGTAGEQTSLTSTNLAGDMRDSNLQYAYIQDGGIINKEIAGDGSAIINVYCARRVYTFTFDLNLSSSGSSGPNLSVSMVFGGTTYTGSTEKYSFNAKYEQDISGMWPSYSTAQFAGTGRYLFITTNYNFQSWTPDSKSVSSGSNWATKRVQLEDSMLSSDGQTQQYTLKASWSSSGSAKTVAYLVEALQSEIDDPGIQKYIYSGKQYVEIKEMRDTVYTSSNIDAKALLGFTNPTILTWNSNGTVGSGNNRFTLTAGANESPHRVFLYSRNPYTLSFNLNGGVGNLSSIIVAYNVSLSVYKPNEDQNPLREGFEFCGWYYDEEGKNPVEWEEIAMPAFNLTLFAKWESREVIVNYYDRTESNDDGLVYTQGYAKEESIKFPTEAGHNGIAYSVGESYENKGTLEYWGYYSSGRLVRINENTTVAHVLGADDTLNLYAKWKTNGFTITYHAGEGSGEVPVDSNTYALNTAARVQDSNDLTGNAGKIFYAWQEEDGSIYYPGSIITIYKNTILTALYADEDNLITVTYHSNLPEIADHTVQMPKNTTANLAGAVFEMEGMVLLGWTTDPDGTTVEYDLGSSYMFEGEDLEFYAVWETMPMSTLTVKKVVEGLYADLSREFGIMISLENESENGIYTYTKYNANNEEIQTGGLEFISGQAVVSLSDGQYIEIQLPVKYAGTVEEVDGIDGFEAAYSLTNTYSGLDKESGSFQMWFYENGTAYKNNDAKVTITNTSTLNPVDTNASHGMTVPSAGWLFISVFVLGCLLLIMSFRRRRQDSCRY